MDKISASTPSAGAPAKSAETGPQQADMATGARQRSQTQKTQRGQQQSTAEARQQERAQMQQQDAAVSQQRVQQTKQQQDQGETQRLQIEKRQGRGEVIDTLA